MDGGRDTGLFTGSLSAIERSKAFTGPGEAVIAERELHAEGLRPPEERRPPEEAGPPRAASAQEQRAGPRPGRPAPEGQPRPDR